MNACSTHREYVAAIADGETALVPAATLDHVRNCAACADEVRAHQVLTSKLRQATEQLEQAAPTRRFVPQVSTRLIAVVTGVAVLILVAAAGVGWSVLSRPDPVQAAVNASTQPLQIESSDPSQVGRWCLQASGRTLPALQLDGMQVVGARMDRSGSMDIVTVVYFAPSGVRVTVSWLEGQALAGSGVEARDVSGHQLLIVHSAVGIAVISSLSSDVMWQTAASIESAAA
ncbi:MAG TPA: hypothetical protein VND96_07675 [Candidatus Micrarchaeaceae archaeon]|nr:hypothetical protein [Candidatus Micrarchaeaceae archaeon]